MGDDTDKKKAEVAKRVILARRARFVAAALASVAVTGVEACGGSTEPVPGTESSSSGASGSSGSSGASSGTPRPCLEPPSSSSSSASSSGIPQPCLSPPIDVDAGNPQPCLKIAFDGGPPDAGDH